MPLGREVAKLRREHQVHVLRFVVDRGGVVVDVRLWIVLVIRHQHDRHVLGAQERPRILRLAKRPRLERIVDLDPRNAALVRRVVGQRSQVDDVFADSLVPQHDRWIVGKAGEHATDFGELQPIGGSERIDAVGRAVEGWLALEQKQLVSPGRIGIVGIQKDRREAPAANRSAGGAEMQTVVTLVDRDAVVPDVHANLALVLDHSADMPHQRLALGIEDLPQLLPGLVRNVTRSLFAMNRWSMKSCFRLRLREAFPVRGPASH